MDWFCHPAYTLPKKRLIARFYDRVYDFRRRRIRQLIFLCGAAQSPNRGRVLEYIEKKHTDKMVFYADDVWAHLSGRKALNALQMEDRLGQLSDAVIILVESPGTFAELGAFSLSSELRKKLLPIIDKQFESKLSFINSGPIRWVNQDSIFKPALYADFREILTVAPQIDDRLKSIPRPQFKNISDIASRPRYLLFLLLDLLSVITPAPEKHIDYYLRQIITENPSWRTIDLLALGVALKLIRHFSVNDITYYCRASESEPWKPFLHKNMFSIEEERTILLSALDRIPAARCVMEQMRSHNI